jgi:ankyrin repeat protein
MSFRRRVTKGVLAASLVLPVAGVGVRAQESSTPPVTDVAEVGNVPITNPDGADFPKTDSRAKKQEFIEKYDELLKTETPDNYVNALLRTDWPDAERAFIKTKLLGIPANSSEFEAVQRVIEMVSGKNKLGLEVTSETLENLQDYRKEKAFEILKATLEPDNLIKQVILPIMLPDYGAKHPVLKGNPLVKFMDRSFLTDQLNLDEGAKSEEILTAILQMVVEDEGKNGRFRNISKRTLMDLVRMGANPRQRNEDGETMMYSLADTGNLELFEEFNELGVPVTGVSKEGKSFTTVALFKPKLLRRGLELGAPVEGRMSDQNINTYLCEAVEEGLRESVKALIDHNANVNGTCAGEPLGITLLSYPYVDVRSYKLLFESDNEGNRLDPDTRASNGDNLIRTLAATPVGDNARRRLMTILAYQGVDPGDVNDPLKRCCKPLSNPLKTPQCQRLAFSSVSLETMTSSMYVRNERISSDSLFVSIVPPSGGRRQALMSAYLKHSTCFRIASSGWAIHCALHRAAR